ncbi:MAG: Wzz/FepE/Etk N-terminal domain-containing protein [Agathobacter sp.]|nr:Wzz/FepE/Etk N-terminal domain-containing protein [Agathobacter sp.]
MSSSVSNHDEIEINLSQLFYNLWRNIVWIILAAVLCADIGYGISTFAMTPIYTASADMIVNNRQGASSGDVTVTTSDLNASSSLVSTYSVILKSHTVLEEVINTLGLDYSYNELANMVSVSTVNDTQVMRVTVKNADPQVALNIVTQIISIAPAVIIDKAEVGSVKTVDQPWSSGKPVSPNKKKFIFVCTLIGILLMCAFLVIKELMNNTFKTEADITRELGLPILGVIPLEEGDAINQGEIKFRNKQ